MAKEMSAQERVLRELELFIRLAEAGPSEVAAELGLNGSAKGTISRDLRQLAELGFLDECAQGRYSIGPKAAALWMAHVRRRQRALANAAEEVRGMEDALAEALEEPEPEAVTS